MFTREQESNWIRYYYAEKIKTQILKKNSSLDFLWCLKLFLRVNDSNLSDLDWLFKEYEFLFDKEPNRILKKRLSRLEVVNIDSQSRTVLFRDKFSVDPIRLKLRVK